jgi:hypothetical protein
MRDNFTNTRTNFQYAADELTDLQNNVVLKAALSGTTLDNNLGNNVVYNALVKGISGTVVAIANTSGTITIDCSAGHYQSINMAGNIALSFTSNTWPTAGTLGMVRTQITVDQVGRTLTLPGTVGNGIVGIQGYANNVITFANTGTYEFGFSTTNAGNAITMFDLNRPLSYYTNPVIVANTAVSTNASSGALIVAGGVGVAGNLYVTGDIVGNFVVTGQTFTGNVSAGNFLSSGLVSATSNVIGGNISTAGLVTATGNITGSNLNAAGLSLSGNVLSAINMTANITTTGGNLQAGNLLTGGIASSTGNITGGNLRTTGQVSATGNITGGNLITSAAILGASVTASGNITGSNINTAGIVSATGNIIGGNLSVTSIVGTLTTAAQTNITSVGTLTSLAVTANVTGGNLTTAGQVSATGNITGNYFLGNGSQLTGISSLTAISAGTTNMTVNGSGGNISATIGGTSNVAVFTSTGINVLGTVSASGNITGSNINTGAQVVATGNITGGNINTGAQVVATGNITGGNLTTGAQVVAIGNITGGNLRTAGQLLAASATSIAAGGSQSLGLKFSTTADFGIFFGSGAPTISAAKGSLYLRSDGSTTNDRMYVNTNGGTTWTAVITAA